MENKNIEVTEQEVQKVFNKIKAIVVDYLSCTEDELVLDATWHDDLMADSLDLAYILRDVELLYGVRMNDQIGWTTTNTLRETCTGIAQTLKENGLPITAI